MQISKRFNSPSGYILLNGIQDVTFSTLSDSVRVTYK